MTPAIFDLASDGSRKLPPIRFDKEIEGALYLDRWYYEPGKGRALKKCKTRLVTPDNITLEVRMAHDAIMSDRIFVHLEEIGLLRGKVTRVIGGVIQMDIELDGNARARLASHLLYLYRREKFQMHDVRPFPRFQPKNTSSRLFMKGNRPLDCSIAAVSPTGAEVITPARPAVRSRLALGQIDGHVVQHTDSGFGMSFFSVQDPRVLEELIFVEHASAPLGHELTLQHSQMVS